MRFFKHLFRSFLSILGFKFCEYCGGFLRGDAKKCSDCGSIVRDADVFSWGWCAVGAMLSPVGLIAGIVFLCKKKKERAASALVGALIQLALIGIAVALFMVMQSKGIALI